MLDVIRRGELPPADGGLRDQEWNDGETKHRDQGGIKQDGESQRLQQFVSPVPHAFAVPRQTLRFRRPGAPEGARDFPAGESVNALSVTRACRILRRGDVAVMALVVFDIEVAVA